MANRRMFAKSIIDTDLFLNMPISTQVLYFHLAIRADDDGFVGSPRKIQRMVGCGDDDMKLLLARGYIIAFDSGVVVITHWKIHNEIRKDRYTPTIYTDEKKQLKVEKNRSYAIGAPDVIPDVIPTVDTGKDRLGKGSQGEIITTSDDERPDFNTVEVYATSNLEYMSAGNMEQLVSFLDDLPENVIRYAIDCACANGKRKWSYVSKTLQNWLEAGVRTLGDAKAKTENWNKEKKAKEQSDSGGGSPWVF